MRVLFTTTVVASHLCTMVPVAWAMRNAGHDVLVTCPDNGMAAVRRAGLPVVSCGPALRLDDLMHHDRESHVAQSADRADSVHAGGRGWGRLAAHSLPGMLDLVSAWQPDLLVNNWVDFAGPVAAAAHGVPRAQLRWGVDELPGYSAGAAEELAADLARYRLAAAEPPPVVLDQWPASLRRPHASRHHGVRFVPYDEAPLVPRWATRPGGRPRVCLTAGTVLTRHKGAGQTVRVLRRLAASVGRLDVDVVVALDDAVAKAWGPPTPGILHIGWVALAPVVAGCAAVVHHGGQGTTLAALAAGRPQVFLPAFGDQFGNAEAVAGRAAGIVLEHPDPDTATDAVRRVLDDPSFRVAAADVATEMTMMPPLSDVVGTLEKAAAR